MHRRTFVNAVTADGVVTVVGSLSGAQAVTYKTTDATESPYGPLLAPDANNIALPDGFTSRVIARSTRPIGNILWHAAPDGGACFSTDDGWIYVSNSDLPLVGGASAIRFNVDGSVDDAYSILTTTSLNCAGEATPWKTWLSCEEIFRGKIFETDPYGAREPVERLAMGRFKHDGAACDPDRRVLYLTEAEADGCLYRFSPDTWEDLGAGTLEVLCGSHEAPVWREVPDPAPTALRTQTRHQVDDALHFNGGHGCRYDAGICYFTATGEGTVWAYDADGETMTTVDDTSGGFSETGTVTGDSYTAETAGDMGIDIVVGDGRAVPVLRIEGHDDSEITGPAFSPDGTRLYFSSQRGASGSTVGTDGVTYEITGPFRH
ncbi:MAG TPA: PhoX family protein [Candidatus Stackebrandtia excrementipullorum]|nr:PhoX family protein [Candidatus Stackebrandtia excrementipullorum]